ncbi:MAG: hypothetical protein ACW98F_18855 [Candidatus Hodarchaeales archaeon]|jgi:hypothetical protein
MDTMRDYWLDIFPETGHRVLAGRFPGINTYPELIKSAINRIKQENDVLAGKLEVLFERKYGT